MGHSRACLSLAAATTPACAYESAKALLVLGGAALVVYVAGGPCLRFLGRNLFFDGRLFTPLHRLWRTRSHQAKNKEARKAQNRWNKVYTKRLQIGRQ